MNPAILSVVAQRINNPLVPYSSTTNGVKFLQDFLPALITIAFVIGVIIFFFMLILGAISWITSGGDKAAVEAARSRVTNAIVGIVILLAIYAIVSLVELFFDINITTIDIGSLIIGGSGGTPPPSCVICGGPGGPVCCSPATCFGSVCAN
ncbi:MAG: hypothetical protein BMS9Abin21_141 [Thermodesulfovibrionia bacterium]|nr:MAG: hypothetical protein BMS9Abin21_141 [Thermodesulfovibrionia bacterium]